MGPQRWNQTEKALFFRDLSLVAHSQLVDIHSLLSNACSLARTAAQMIDLTLVFFPKTYGGLSSAGGMTKPRRINSANRS